MRLLHLLLTLCIAAAAAGRLVEVPAPWARASFADPHPDDVTRVIVGLTQENLDILEAKFWDVSSTRSENYAQYLTHDELAAIVAPTDEHIDAITTWLSVYGVEKTQIDVTKTRDVLYVRTEVRKVEKAFGVVLEAYQHQHTGKIILRSSTTPVIPGHIESHIDIIHDIVDFPPMKRRSPPVHHIGDEASSSGLEILSVNARAQTPDASLEVTLSVPSGSEAVVMANSTNANILATFEAPVPASACQDGVCTVVVQTEFYVPLTVSAKLNGNDSVVVTWPYPTLVTPHVSPKMLYDLYNIPSSPRVTQEGATQCVVEFEQQYYSPSDLDEYFDLFSVPASSSDVVEVGPNDPQTPGAEANLDIQWIMGMAPGSKTWFWSIYANSTVEIDHILTWCYEVGNYTDPPLVNSLSYGMTEDNVDRFLGDGYLQRTDSELQKLALQGLTIIIADGDTGANDLGPPPMSQVRCFPSHADWPSDSQYVTSIGSTFMTPLSDPICYVSGGADCLANPVGEAGVSVAAGMTWTTGGGFSNFTTRPAFQDSFVEEFFATSDDLPPADYYNANGRAYADAVTVGHNLEVVLSGDLVAIDGTSASAPIFAGIVTLLNNARLEVGKNPLGYITQAMYQIAEDAPQCWNDISVGANNCGSVGWKPTCCADGYTATVGWDPVSGLGSPNFDCLRAYVVSLP